MRGGGGVGVFLKNPVLNHKNVVIYKAMDNFVMNTVVGD